MIVFSLLLVGCLSSGTPKHVWPEPVKPIKLEVVFVPVVTPEPGLFISEQSAKNLVKNIDELDAYIAEQDAIIKGMKVYYHAE